MKKTIKINFVGFWKDFDPSDNLFSNLLRKKYNVVLSRNPDYVFYSVYPPEKDLKDFSKWRDFVRKISPKGYLFLRKILRKLNNQNKKIQSPKGNFVKIFYTGENVKPDMDECDWAFSFYYDEEFNHPRHLRLPNYKFLEEDIDLTKNKKNINRIINEKKNFCNFLYSQEVPYRNKFFKALNKYKRVHSPGKCMQNMAPLSKEKRKFSNLPANWIQEKLSFLKSYKFTIAFENNSTPGYTTEKIYHAMIANSIPIYFGNPLVNRDFNTKSFINCHDFPNFEEVINYVKKIDEDPREYKKILNEPWFEKNKKSKYMDDKRILNQLIKIIETKNEK